MTVLVRSLLNITVSLCGLVFTWLFYTYIEQVSLLSKRFDDLTLSFAGITKKLSMTDIAQPKLIFSLMLVGFLIYGMRKALERKRYLIHARLWLNRQLWQDWEVTISIPCFVVISVIICKVYA